MKRPVQPAILERQQHQRAIHYARFQEVCDRYQAGATISAIAYQTGLDCKTVRKFSQALAFPEQQPTPQRATIFDPYKPYLR